MNILVLGGAGFIGRHLCAALIHAGHQVTSLDLLPAGGRVAWPDIPGVSWRSGDFTNVVDTAAALVEVELVVHLISTTLPKSSNDNPLYDLQENVGGTLQLLDLMVRQPNRPRIIFLSSGGTIYGVPRQIPIPEEHPTEPLCAYGIGKLAIEKYLALYQHLHGLDYRVLRLANPYGEHQSYRSSQGVIPVFLYKALQGEAIEVWGDGTVIRDYIYIDDAVQAIMATICYDGPERIFNIGDGKGYSLNELIDITRRLVANDIPCTYLSTRACDVPVNILNISRARQELGWQPVTALERGMTRLLEHLRDVR